MARKEAEKELVYPSPEEVCWKAQLVRADEK